MIVGCATLGFDVGDKGYFGMQAECRRLLQELLRAPQLQTTTISQAYQSSELTRAQTLLPFLHALQCFDFTECSVSAVSLIAGAICRCWMAQGHCRR